MEQIGRQALHCVRVSFTHPVTGKSMTIHAGVPEDMQKLISRCRIHVRNA